MVFSLKKALPFLVLLFCLFNSRIQELSAERFSVNFDCLAPATDLQIVLEHCLRIQHELDVCNQQDLLDKSDLVLFVDMMVGKLFHLQFCAKKLSSSKKFMYKEDILYVLKIVKHIKTTFQNLQRHELPEQAMHIETLLEDVEGKLLALK